MQLKLSSDISVPTGGVIFDFNGTMFFDQLFQEASWKIFLENAIGRTPSNEEFETYVHGRNANASLPYFFQKELSQTEIEALEEEKETVYRALCLEHPDDFRLADGLPHFLDELVKYKTPITIATASSLNNVEFFFEHLSLGRWFDFDKVAYNDGTIPGKPQPDLYWKAAELLRVKSEDCVVFEDAPSGIESAKRAGARAVIGVASTMSEERLLSYGVLAAVKDYQKLEVSTSSV